jgi:hypothetical protein
MTGDLGPRARVIFVAVLVLLGACQWLLHEPTKSDEPRRPAPEGPTPPRPG